MSGQVFTLDQGDKETLEATIHLPQTANPGDVLTVQQDRSIAAAAGGGGSSAGGVKIADFIFNEPAAPHPDLTATFTVPAGATVLDIILYPLAAPWADSVNFAVGDTNDAAGYFPFIDLGGGLSNPYDPTNVTTGGNFDFSGNTADAGAYHVSAGPPLVVAATPGGGGGVLYPAGDTITMTASGIATGGGGGQLLVRILYVDAITPVIAA